MDKKVYNEQLAELNKTIKELEQETTTITTITAFKDIEKRVNKVLAEKMNLEKTQLEDLRKIAKNRISKKTKSQNAIKKKKRDHCLYKLGGDVSKIMDDFVDINDDVFKKAQAYLRSEQFKENFEQTESDRERNQRLCTLGSLIETQLGSIDDEELFKKIQNYLQSDWLKHYYDQYFIKKAEALAKAQSNNNQ